MLTTVFFPFVSIKADRITIYVDDDNTAGPWDGSQTHPYQTITDALGVAEKNDTIEVLSGAYEENIYIDIENLTLKSTLGSASTILKAADGSNHAISISSPNVTIKGFSITNATDYDCFALYCDYAQNLTIDDNIISENFGAIWFDSVTNSQIKNNHVFNNSNQAIVLSYSEYNVIEANNCSYNCNSSEGGGGGEGGRGGSTAGISLSDSHNNTLQSNICLWNGAEDDWGESRFGSGIALSNSNYNILSQNDLLKNFEKGLEIKNCNNVTVSGCVCSLNGGITSMNVSYGTGLEITYSTDILVDGNEINGNIQTGLMLEDSKACTLDGNELFDNGMNFGIQGYETLFFIHDIDATNTINGDPIVYKIGTSDDSISGPVGYLALINCENMSVESLSVSSNYHGVCLINSSHCSFEHVQTSNNIYGFYMLQSNNNSFTNCDAINNSKLTKYDEGAVGFYLLECNNNSFSDCDLKLQKGTGVWGDTYGYGVSGEGSNFNLFSNCVFESNNDAGISFQGCWNNSVNNSFFSNNSLRLDSSMYNLIMDNVFKLSTVSLYDADENYIQANEMDGQVFASGVSLSYSHNNNVTENNIHSCSKGVSLSYSHNNNVTENNIHSCSNGVDIYRAHENSVVGNSIVNNSNYGILIQNALSYNNEIFNNYFNNSNNAKSEAYCIWNTEKTSGTNIISGPYLGGNFWNDYIGADLDGDGLGDENIPYTSGGDIGSGGGDSLPLVSAALNPPTIISSSPASPVENTQGQSRMFSISADQIVNVTWSINGSEKHSESLVSSSNYSNLSAVSGVWSVQATIENENGSDSIVWSWNVSSLPGPVIIQTEPSSPVSCFESETQEFSIEVDQVVDIVWKINGSEVFSESDVMSSTYQNASAVAGFWQVSAFVENQNGSDQHLWLWNVTAHQAPQIISKTPQQSSVFGLQGQTQIFQVQLDQPANISWFISGKEVASASMVSSHSYENMSSIAGVWNCSVFVENQYGFAVERWTWIVYEDAMVHNLNTSKSFVSIQAAIDDEQTINGNSIIVDAGILHENIVVDKQVEITGSEGNQKTIIYAADSYLPVFSLKENNVTVSSFSIESALGYLSSGVYADGVCCCILSNISIKDCFHGIFLNDSERIQILNSDISSNKGVVLQRSNNNSVVNNTISSCWNDGVILNNAANNLLRSNHVSNNSENGIFVNASDANVFENNTIDGNYKTGIYLIYSSTNSIVKNSIYANSFRGISVFFESANNSFSKNEIKNNELDGIYFYQSNQNKILDNSIYLNKKDGVNIDQCSQSHVTDNSVFSNKDKGIGIIESPSSDITNNSISYNGDGGIEDCGLWIDRSNDSMIFNCSLWNNSYNVGIQGFLLKDFYFTLDSSNSVNGKTVYYYIEQNGVSVPLDAGFVGFINCSNMIAKDLELSNNHDSLLAVNLTHSNISNCSFIANLVGIKIIDSTNNTIEDCEITQSDSEAIALTNAKNNTIENCAVYNCTYSGIKFEENSNENKISECFFSDNYRSILLLHSSNSNSLIDNELIENNEGIILGDSYNNRVSSNVFEANMNSIVISFDSSNSNISDNLITNSSSTGISISTQSDECVVHNNTLSGNFNGISIGGNTGSLLSENIIVNCSQWGVELFKSENLVLSKNLINNCSRGLYLNQAKNCSLTENSVEDCIYSFYLESEVKEDVHHFIDETNLLDGSPIKYLMGSIDSIIEGDIGFVACIDCNNITIRDCNLTNNSHGVLLYNTSNSSICNVSVQNNSRGVEINGSWSNVLYDNVIENNFEKGLFMYDSNQNLIYNNRFNNSENVIDEGVNIWNVTKTAGNNCVGGSYLGGNYWNKYHGLDLDADGIGDTLIPYNESADIVENGDFLPLIPMEYDHDIYIPIINCEDLVSTGSTMFVNASISNNGRFNETGVLIDLLVDDQLIDTQSIDVDSHSSKSVSFSWTVDIFDLDYVICIKAHPVSGEIYIGNNQITKTIEAYSLVNLSVVNISWSPVDIFDGDEVVFTATIKNGADDTTYRTFVTSFFVDGQLIGSKETLGIGPNESVSLSQGWISNPLKNTVRVCVDDSQIVRETNEADNNKSRSFIINKADLIVSSLSWSPNNITDGEVTTFAANIENIGSTTLRRFVVKFYCDGSLIGQKRVDGLASGSSTVLNQVWPADAGNHSFEVSVDALDEVIEGNETNNVFVKDIFNISKSDLIVSDVSWFDPDITDSENIQFNATITNVGLGNTSQRFYVDFRIDGEIGCECAGPSVVVVEGLAAGESTNVSGFWRATAGNHSLMVVVDSGDDVFEAVEDNNNYSIALPEVLTSDLIITGISPTSSQIYAGDIVSFNISYENIGSGDLFSFAGVEVAIGSYSKLHDFVLGVPAMGSDNETLDRTWIAQAGTYNVTAWIDFEQSITEEDESNNFFYSTITVSDNTPPTARLIPANGSVEEEVFEIVALISDGYGVGVDFDSATFTVMLDSSPVAGSVDLLENDNLVFTPSAAFEDGNYSVILDLYDLNANHKSMESGFCIDSMYPDINISNLVENAVYEQPLTPSISVIDSSLAEVEILLNDDPFVLGSTISFEGSYSLCVQASDASGHLSEACRNFSLNLAPSAPLGLTVQEEIESNFLQWLANTEDDIVGYNVYRNGSKINVDPVVATSFVDDSIAGGQSYEYSVSAVDLVGHESEKAFVQQVSFNLVEYGLIVDDEMTLTKGMVDVFIVNVTNVLSETIVVDSLCFMLTDEAGVQLFVKNLSGFSLSPGEVETTEITAPIGNVYRLCLSASIDESNTTRWFVVNVRDTPSDPIEVAAPTILEGYADEIELIINNFGSAPLQLLEDDIKMELLDGSLLPLSLGGGSGSWDLIEPNQTKRFLGYFVTPMAIGEDIHLENLSLKTSFNLYYGASFGQDVAAQYCLVDSIQNLYVTVPALNVYHPTLREDSEEIITVRLINQGSGSLHVASSDIEVRLISENGAVLAEEQSSSPVTSTVSPEGTLDVPITIQVPVDVPERIFVVAELSASCDASSPNATKAVYRSESLTSTVPLEYDADASTEQSLYCGTDTIFINGSVLDENDSKVPFEGVKIRISNRGFIREYYTLSDGTGDYSFQFNPMANEAGKYVVSASHPDAQFFDKDCEFEVLGLFIEHVKLSNHHTTPYPSNIFMLQTDIVNTSVIVSNLGESIIQGIEISVVDRNASDNIEALFDDSSFDLLAGESKSITISLVSDDSQCNHAYFEVIAICDAGCMVSSDLYVTLNSISPSIQFSKNHIQTGIKPGSSSTKSVNIINTGFAPLLNVSLSLPEISWISLTSNQFFEQIGENSFAPIEVFIHPPENVSNGLYNDEIVISSDNYINLTFVIQIIVTSQQTGSIEFDVVNQLGQHLPGAVVSIIDQQTGSLSFSTQTDINGIAVFSNIPCGRYSYSMYAENHYDLYGSETVEMAVTKQVSLYTTYSFIQYEWYVVETEVEDVYDVVHNITYDSQSPLPYLKVEDPEFGLFMAKGATYHGQFNITNMNDIVSALNVTPAPDIDNELVTIDFLVESIPEIKPHETVTIPYVVKLAEHHSPQAKACEKVKISIPINADLNCMYCLYGEHSDTPFICFYDMPVTDTLNFEVSPGCFDFMKSVPDCALEIIEYVFGVKIVLDAPKWIKLMFKAYDVIKKIANCFTQSYCNGWPALDCASDIYGICGGPGNACIGAAKDLAKCMFQDTCCGKEPSARLIPPLIIPGAEVIHPIGFGAWTAPGLPTPNIRKGPCKHSPETMCIQAKIAIPQEQTLERQAFNANLRLYNIMPDYDMSNVSVRINITDEQGNHVEDLFFVDVSYLNNLESLEGGYINANEFSDIQWFFIPTPGAGGNDSDGRWYDIVAYVEYTVNGKQFSFETFPEDILVRPMPLLILDYVLPKHIVGDDPMTVGTIETPVPFMWGVRVKNVGFGEARDLKIDSAQPEIIEQTSGVDLSFELLGSYVDGLKVQDSLSIDFGDLQAGDSITAGWQMLCSVSGNFSNYTASFTHSDSLGGAATSLLSEINTHVLVHEFVNDMPGRDSMFDFLVDSDDDGIADFIIDSEGFDENIMLVSCNVSGSPSNQTPYLDVSLNKTSESDWVYTMFADPLNNSADIEYVVRLSDGKILNSSNYWVADGFVYLVDDPEIEYRVFYDRGPGNEQELSITNIVINPVSQNVGGVVNISCLVSSDNSLESVHINITTPSLISQEFEMSAGQGSEFFFESSFGVVGEYEFFISAQDAMGLFNVSQSYGFSIVDGSLPEIIDFSPSSATTGDVFVFNVSVSDSEQISGVFVTYWFGSEMPVNVSLSQVGDSEWYQYSFVMPSNSIDAMNYSVCAMNILGLWNHSSISRVELTDNDAPLASGVLEPVMASCGDGVLISYYATDNIGIVDASLNVSGVQYSFVEEGRFYNYSLSIPIDFVGSYWYVASFADANLNSVLTNQKTLVVSDNVSPIISLADASPSQLHQGNFVNISCDVSDNIGVASANLIVQGPVGFSDINVSLSLVELSYNHSYDVVGNYSFYVYVVDSSGNHNVSASKNFCVVQSEKPILIDHSNQSVGTGNTALVNCSVVDDAGIQEVFVLYNFEGDSSLNVSMERIGSTEWFEYTFSVPSNRTDDVLYSIHAVDIFGVWNQTDLKTMSVFDDDEPVVSVVQDYVQAATGDVLLFSYEAYDNIGISSAIICIDAVNHSLVEEGVFFNYSYDVLQDSLESVSYYVFFEDSAGNLVQSAVKQIAVFDDDLPVISDLVVEPLVQNCGGFVNISCQISDNILVDYAVLNISYPSGNESSVLLNDSCYCLNQSYSDIGVYSCVVWAVDSSNNSNVSEEFSFEIVSESIIPVVSCDGPYVGFVAQDVGVDASQSFDPDGYIVNWTWDFGDGTISYGETLSHQYSSVGNYTITLTVTDDDGLQNSTSTYAIITLQSTVDQSQEQYNYDIPIFAQRFGAQSFKPHEDQLSEIHLYLSKIGSPQHNLILSIRESLSGEDLVTLPLSADQIQSQKTWVEFDIEDLSVTPDQTYYIILHTEQNSQPLTGYYLWGCGYRTEYQRGILHFSTNQGSRWMNLYFFDFCFKSICGPSIPDTSPPQINDVSSSFATTGDSFSCVAEVVDDASVDAVFVEYWYDGSSPQNLSLVKQSDVLWEGCFDVLHSLDNILYRISAVDDSGNWNHSSLREVEVFDNDAPVVENVQLFPEVQTTGSFVNLSCVVSDNIEVGRVFANIVSPSDVTVPYDLVGSQLGFYLNQSYVECGMYALVVFAVDSSNNSGFSEEVSFEILPEFVLPSVGHNGPFEGFVAQDVGVDASQSFDPDGYIVNWTWDFGDGTISYGETLSHQYSSVGNYTITLTVTDDDGLQNSTSTYAIITLQSTVDQSQEQYNYDIPIFAQRFGAQSFKPHEDQLSEIHLYLSKIGSPQHNLILSIRESLSGEDLVTLPLSADQIQSQKTWVEFDIEDLSVTPDQTYYIILHTEQNSQPLTGYYLWGCGYRTEYQRGILHFSTNQGSRWMNLYFFDFCFKSYAMS